MMKLFKVLMLICCISLSLTAHAQVVSCDSNETVRIDYADFSDNAGLQLNGTTVALNPNADNVLRLTNGLNQSGSVFASDAIPLTTNSAFLASFSSAFSFRIANPIGISDEDGSGADGLVFILQTVDNSVGGGGGGLGYAGINNSLGIEFDTYNNGFGDQNSGNHVGINFNGSTTSSFLQVIEQRLNDGVRFYVWVDYNGETQVLEVRLSTDSVRPTAPTISASDINLPTILGSENAFVGFSSGTAAAGGQHDIIDFKFINRYAPNGVCNNRPPQITSEPKTVQILQPVVANPELIDLSTWQVINYPGNDPNSNWVISSSGNEVVQRNNANPSIFLSDFTLSNGQTRGRFTVGSSSDDDFIGFVFGYQNTTNFYLFDWKQRNQGQALVGMRVKRFSGDVNPSFWPSNPPGDAEVLYVNSIPWQDPVEYEFQLDFFPGEFEIKITRISTGAILDQFRIQDDTYLTGGFGFYNFSQGPVTYKGFDLGFTSSREYVYAVQAADPDGDALTYSLIDGPSRMAIDPSTGVVSWITTSVDIGLHSVTIEVRDGNGGFERQSFILEVTDSVPSISTDAPLQAQAGRLYSYDVDADDPTPNDVLVYSLEQAPAGMVINANSGLVEWVAGTDDIGITPISIRVEDRIGGFDLQNYDLNVMASTGNAAPEISSSPAPRAQVGFEYAYDVIATDAESSDLIYSLVSAPQGMTIDASQGQIRWTPNASQLGLTSVNIRVNDGADGYAAQLFSIEVIAANANAVPVISSEPDLFVLEGDGYVYQIVAADAEGDSLSYLLLEGPEQMQISASGEVTWLASSTNGTVVRVRVFDGTAYADQQWLLGSSDGELRVDLSVSPVVAKLDDAVTVQVSLGAMPSPVATSLLIDGLPVGLDENNRVTINNSGLGTHTAVVTASVTDTNGIINSQSTSASFIVVDDVAPASEIAFNVENLAFQASGDDITLSWSPPFYNADSVTAYQVFLDGELVETLAAGNHSTQLTDLSLQSIFEAKVVTENSFNNTSVGAIKLIATAYSNPVNISAIERDALVRLSWPPLLPISGVGHYNVYLETNSFTDVASLTPITTANRQAASATLSGLTNLQTYYVAVTTVNLAGVENTSVNSIAVTPSADTTPPSIEAILFNEIPLIDNQVIGEDGIICVQASDDRAISRVTFLLDQNQIGIDSDADSNGYCTQLSIANLDNGSYQLDLSVYDNSENRTDLPLTINVQLAVPDAPTITSPVNGLRTSQILQTVSGIGLVNLEVQVAINDQLSDWFFIDASGSFSVDISLLDEGDNVITAKTRNRAGESLPSASVTVVLDTQLPAKPLALSASPSGQGVIDLQWSPGSGIGVAGFNVYRATQEFDDLASAQLLNAQPLLNTTYEDLVLEDGEYFYRVVAINDVDSSSEPSSIASATADSVAPKADAIRYSTDGAFDSASNTYGRGIVSIEVDVSESLLTTPFLSITPDGGVPINVTLVQSSAATNRYLGAILLDENVSPGRAFAVFSARDLVGNRGTDIDTGAEINIDTLGPIVTGISLTPSAPILNDQNSPTSVVASFSLSEAVGNASSFDVRYRLSGSGREPVVINNIAQADALTWQASFDLPADAGLDEPESLSFEFTAADALGNLGSSIEPSFSAQVYQGDLPPFAAPFNFRATAGAAGVIELQWFEVEGAEGYQLYRKAPGETEFSDFETIAQGDSYSDNTTLDGEYEYQISTLRMANGVESESARSEIVSASSDSLSPEAPTGLTLESSPTGVVIRWQAVSETGVEYRVYRVEAEPVDTTSVDPIISDISELLALDSNATQSQPVYAVTAVDAVGNQSPASEVAYLNVDLLPISTLQVELKDQSKPVVSWTHNSVSINQFDVFLGADASGTKLNDTVISGNEYIDEGYANNTREYAVVALDANDQSSLARHILLPQVTLSLTDDDTIQRNLINALSITIDNHSSVEVANSLAKLVIDDRTYRSEPFNLSASESKVLSINVPGLADLADVLDVDLVFESRPNVGELISITSATQLQVIDGALGIDLETDEFLRGGSGSVRFTINNTGSQPLELITALNNGNANSNDVVFSLSDDDGNIVSLAPFRQALGEGVVTRASGETHAIIDGGSSWTSDAVDLSVPLDAPDRLTLLVQINSLYNGRGQPEEVRISGPQRRQAISLEDTNYSGTVDSVTPESSFGDVPIVISGQAIDSSSQQPLANVDLSIVISNNGFERVFEVITDSDGNYLFSFEPQTQESGRYIVSALNPKLTIRPNHAEFTIGRLMVTPSNVVLRLPYQLDFELPLTFAAGDGTSVTNLNFAIDPTLQPSGALPVGITLGYPDIPSVIVNSPVEAKLMIRAEQEADESGELVISVFSDESVSKSLATIKIRYQLSAARPALTHSPSILELGTTLQGSTGGEIELSNQGSVPLQAARLSLKTNDGFDAPTWLSIATSTDVGDIEVGETVDVNLLMQPNGLAPIGIQHLFLEVTSSNAQPYNIPIVAIISEDGQGGVLLKVTDMYTGTLDAQGRIFQGLADATVRLQNELIPDLQFTAQSDSVGEILLDDIPAGRYSLLVAADNYQEVAIRMRIQPGVINSQQVFLDFNLIRLEWSVREITIEDRYQVVLQATFETDVPAAVVMMEPTNIDLPVMQPGDVFYGELTLTNYGLIRAFDVDFSPAKSDQYYQFEYLNSAVPDSLEAKEVVTIPYKVTSLSNLPGGGAQAVSNNFGAITQAADSFSVAVSASSQAAGSGGGCGSYARCASVNSSSRCPTGVSDASSKSCLTRSFGSCRGDGGRFIPIDLPYGGGGGSRAEGAGGLPPCRGDGDCSSGNGGGGSQ